jgi:thioredoxin-related protein
MQTIFKLLFIIFFFGTSIQSDSIWIDNFEKGIQLSKSKDIPIVLDLYTDWCTYCKVLENKVFPDEAIQKQLSKFNTIRLNADEYPDLVSLYRVSGYPTILFLDKNGAYIDKLVGLPTVNHLEKKLIDVYSKKDLEKELLSSVEKNKQSILFNYNLALYYISARLWDKSENYLIATINSKDTEFIEKKQDAMYYIGVIHLKQKKYSESASIWSKYLLDYPTGDELSARYYRGLSYYHLGKYSLSKDDLIKAKKLNRDPERNQAIQQLLDRIDNGV